MGGTILMANHSKQLLVADFIHNPIEISQIEKYVISTNIFNRLHNILQNSTVYLTYPSNRTSRFSHSLGVMHNAGIVFKNGFINSDIDTKSLFLDRLEEEIFQILMIFETHIRIIYSMPKEEKAQGFKIFWMKKIVNISLMEPLVN